MKKIYLIKKLFPLVFREFRCVYIAIESFKQSVGK